jgi:glycosyltransferase involved in cell wall biosynthesis
MYVMEMTVEPKISLCMVVKNEEAMLPTCLNSVRDLVSEIIIIDTGSIDRTTEIAQLYGAKFYKTEWRDDFAYARNESLKHATGDWILYLDADERIDEGNKAKIRQLLKNDDVMAINVRVVIPQSEHNLVTDFCCNYSRIFRNLPGIHFEGRIHEQIVQSIQRLGGKILHSDIIFDHWGYNKRVEHREVRIQQNLAILKEEIALHPEDPFLHYNLADSYRTIGETNLAIVHFESALQHQKGNLAGELISNIYIFLAQLYMLKNVYDRAIQNALRAIDLTPNEPLPYYILATIDFENNHFLEAQKRLIFILRLIESRKQYFPVSDIDVSQVYLDLGNCYYLQQKFDNAEYYYQKSIAINPNSLEVSFNLGRCYQRKDNLKSARKWYEHALQIDPLFEAARVNLLKCYKSL